MGAWTFAAPEIDAVLDQRTTRSLRVAYIGRPPAASPATGLMRRHLKEQAALVNGALTLGS